eukprot:1925772-Karenia_brevis.AAC.1
MVYEHDTAGIGIEKEGATHADGRGACPQLGGRQTSSGIEDNTHTGKIQPSMAPGTITIEF